MPNLSPRAALLAAMLLLPGAAASALTCVDDPARAETLARDADAIVVARITVIAPTEQPAPPAIPAGAQEVGGANAAMLTAFLTPPTDRDLDIDATEVLKGDVPPGVFRARFLEGPCAHLPAEGKRRIVYLRRDDDGWRMLGSN
ncbi:MAG: hypothetical protein ACJAVR_001253 [Paracoccaceae bacterium]|jgi:hypothetical protein